MQQIVLPIKDSNVLNAVQDTFLHNFKAGQRNYTIFQVGKATLLRVSDVIRLKRVDVFNPDGTVKQNAFLHDKKTGKANTLYLKPVETDLLTYQQWLTTTSPWLFRRPNTQTNISPKSNSTKLWLRRAIYSALIISVRTPCVKPVLIASTSKVTTTSA